MSDLAAPTYQAPSAEIAEMHCSAGDLNDFFWGPIKRDPREMRSESATHYASYIAFGECRV